MCPWFLAVAYLQIPAHYKTIVLVFRIKLKASEYRGEQAEMNIQRLNVRIDQVTEYGTNIHGSTSEIKRDLMRLYMIRTGASLCTGIIIKTGGFDRACRLCAARPQICRLINTQKLVMSDPSPPPLPLQFRCFSPKDPQKKSQLGGQNSSNSSTMQLQVALWSKSSVSWVKLKQNPSIPLSPYSPFPTRPL